MKFEIDVHTHSIVSGHAYSTINENVKAAKEAGLKVYGISDHAPSMPGSTHIFYFQNMKIIPRKMEEVLVLRGAEVNILDYEGRLDLSQEVLEGLDYAVASMHTPCITPGTKEQNTRAFIGAINNPRINIIGHPDDSRYQVDYEAIVLEAKKNNVLLEINNSSLSPKSFREGAFDNYITMLGFCKKHGVKVIANTDAHHSSKVGVFDNVVKLFAQAKFPEELVINSDYKKFLEFIEFCED